MGETVKKAVVLAAGRGTRMRELTVSMPKPMVEVSGKPVLSYILEGLRDSGVQKVRVVIGYRKEVVMDYFGDGSELGVEIVYTEQIRQDGTGKVVELAKDFCGAAPFILSYGDILVDASTYGLLTRPGDADIIITVRHTEDASK